MSKRERDAASDADDSPSKASKVAAAGVSPTDSDTTATSAKDDDLLPKLLDFSSLTSLAEVNSRFDAIAQALLHDHRIVVVRNASESSSNKAERKEEYQILEVEFYLWKPGCHSDPFTHGSIEQKKSGQWYFHRCPRYHADDTKLPGYRGGTRKGLDLTLGQRECNSDIHGGALLRTARRVSDGHIISGPSLLVDELLRASGATTIPQLVEHNWACNISAFSPPAEALTGSNDAPLTQPPASAMYMRRVPVAAATITTMFGLPRQPPRIFRSPRIGLDLSNPNTTSSPTHPRVVFVAKPYRFFTHPECLTANGRAYTFLGVYESCLAADHIRGSDARRPKSDAELIREVVSLMGIKLQTVTNYLATYKEGQKGGSLKTFVGSAGRGLCSSPNGLLTMMGILKRENV